jgi:hypothetical protein
MLNRSWDSVDTYLVPDFRENGFSFSQLSIMLALSLSYIALQCWGTFHLFLVFSELLSWSGVGFCQRFFCIYWDDQGVVVFASINVLYYIYRFKYVESHLHPWGKANLVMVNDLFDVLLDSVCP